MDILIISLKNKSQAKISAPIATCLNCRAGWYDGIIVIPQYVNRPILIPKLFLLYNFIVIDIIAI